MEGIREIARSYFERASDDEKKTVIDFFKKLDVDGDGKVTLPEFKKSVSSWLSAEAVFHKLDSNGDGALDFDEFLSLYYMEKKVKIAKCGGCWDLLVGPYFSCLLCLGKGPLTYDLCCICYRRGDLDHEHPSSCMMDHHSLLMVLREDRTAAAQKSQAKKEMDELREIAKAHYRAGSREVQNLAFEFYRSMDADGDGRVALSEFLAFMRQEGYEHMHNPYFFSELDHDGNGTLDFSEVMTLYYIIKSGRPFCSCCGKFITGIFFSCVECFKHPKNSFDLCPDCYQPGKCNHNHEGRVQFLDNFTLLQANRDLGRLAHSRSLNYNEPWRSCPSNAIVPVQHSHMYVNNTYPTYNTYIVHPPTPASNHSNVGAIVPSNNVNWNKWRTALNALEVALSIGSISATMCTIL